MYSEVIEEADAALGANERLRARAENLCDQARALLVQYRGHRLLHACGGTDDLDATTAAVREKLRSGILPLPPDSPAKSWAGKGTGLPCEGCDRIITPDQIEYELDLPDSRKLRLHADCVGVWHGVWSERQAQLLAGLRILVVDDHEDSRELLQQAFAFLGADVTISATAEDAMRSVANADVVVTDFALKGKDGAWLLAQINASARPIPVVLFSGFVDTQTAGIAEAPFALKLLKPIDPMDLAREIRGLVR